jgi:hypothetical protein
LLSTSLLTGLFLSLQHIRLTTIGHSHIQEALAICFWVIDRFAPADARLKQLLKLLVVLVCAYNHNNQHADQD